MSQENVESFRRAVDAWNRDDFDAWINLLNAKVEWSTLVETYRGHAGAGQAWETLKSGGVGAARYDDIRDLGESVLALGEVETTGPTTHLDFTGELAQLFTYRGGKVVRGRSFRSHAEGLEAAGLREGGAPTVERES